MHETSRYVYKLLVYLASEILVLIHSKLDYIATEIDINNSDELPIYIPTFLSLPFGSATLGGGFTGLSATTGVTGLTGV